MYRPNPQLSKKRSEEGNFAPSLPTKYLKVNGNHKSDSTRKIFTPHSLIRQPAKLIDMNS